MQGVICALSKKEELKMKGGASIKRRDGDVPLCMYICVNQSPVQVGVMGWQTDVSHGECRVRYNCGLSVSALFSLSPRV